MFITISNYINCFLAKKIKNISVCAKVSAKPSEARGKIYR